MTKRIDPEIKTLRAISRLLTMHDETTRQRITWFFYEATHKGMHVPVRVP